MLFINCIKHGNTPFDERIFVRIHIHTEFFKATPFIKIDGTRNGI